MFGLFKKRPPQEHFWIYLRHPETGLTVDGIADEDQLRGYLAEGYELVGKSPAVRADVVHEEASA